jgi:hypothetical protein
VERFASLVGQIMNISGTALLLLHFKCNFWVHYCFQVSNKEAGVEKIYVSVNINWVKIWHLLWEYLNGTKQKLHTVKKTIKLRSTKSEFNHVRKTFLIRKWQKT